MPLLLLVLNLQQQSDMVLEEEQRMLAGSGDPNEVRPGERLDPLRSPEAQDLARQKTFPA